MVRNSFSNIGRPVVVTALTLSKYISIIATFCKIIQGGIAKNSGNTGAIQKILISNNSANTATVRVYLGFDTSNTLDFYFIKNT